MLLLLLLILSPFPFITRTLHLITSPVEGLLGIGRVVAAPPYRRAHDDRHVDDGDDDGDDAVQDRHPRRTVGAPGPRLHDAQPTVDGARQHDSSAEPAVGRAHGAAAAGSAEVDVLVEAERGLDGEGNDEDDVADDLVVGGDFAEGARELDAEREADDQEYDAEDLERGVDEGDAFGVAKVERHAGEGHEDEEDDRHDDGVADACAAGGRGAEDDGPRGG